MSPITKGRKRNKRDSTSTLSDSEFQFLYAGLSYTGGLVDKVKINNMIVEYVKRKR